jgi:hypothetical protein
MPNRCLISAAAAWVRCLRNDPGRRHMARDAAFEARRSIGAILLRRSVAS